MTFSQRCCSCCVLLVVAVLGMPGLLLAGVFGEKPNHGAHEVAMFTAIDAKEIDVTMIPRDSRRVTLQVKNNTDRPLAVRLPQAFAGVPVMAQIGLPPAGGAGGAGMAAPQGLGMGFPGGGGAGAGRNPLLGPGIFGGPRGIMNIPPGKVIKVKRASVCLEHGKPEPGPRIAYRVVPLKHVSNDPSLREMLALLGSDQVDQRIAQIIAWHFSNGMTWEELAGLTIKHFNGRRSPRFSLEEIRQAQRLTAALPSQRKDSKSRRKYASRSQE